MTTDRLIVSFCCNDAAGNPRSVVRDVEVEGLIRLEGPFVFDADLDVFGTTPIRWSFAEYITIDGERFPCHDHRRHAGTILWDSAEMDRAEVVRMLNHLRTLGGWSCVEAEASLFNAWGEREITVADLERASGS